MEILLSEKLFTVYLRGIFQINTNLVVNSVTTSLRPVNKFFCSYFEYLINLSSHRADAFPARTLTFIPCGSHKVLCRYIVASFFFNQFFYNLKTTSVNFKFSRLK